MNNESAKIKINNIESLGQVSLTDNKLIINYGIAEKTINYDDIKIIDKIENKTVKILLLDNMCIDISCDNYLVIYRIISEYIEEKKDSDSKISEYIKCPECKTKNEKTNLECKNCGFPFKNKKNIKKYLLLFSVLIFVCAIAALIIFYIIPELKLKNEKNKYTDPTCFTFEGGIITNYDESCTKDVVIPDVINEEKVVEIGEGAFSEKGIKSIKLPKYLKKIRKEAFYRNKIVSLEIPDSVRKIYSSSFMSNKIKELKLGKNVDLIGSWSFDFNYLEEVNIPNSVKNINYEAFANNNLKKVTIGTGVENIDFLAFGQYDWQDDPEYDDYEQNRNLKTIINKSGKQFEWYGILAHETGPDAPELWLEVGEVKTNFGTITISKE